MHGCPSVRRHAACDSEKVRKVKLTNVVQEFRFSLKLIHDDEMYLSEGHADGLWETRQGLGLRVVLQENAVALKNHIGLTVNHQRALKGFKAHGVAKLPAVCSHLVATWGKGKHNSS